MEYTGLKGIDCFVDLNVTLAKYAKAKKDKDETVLHILIQLFLIKN